MKKDEKKDFDVAIIGGGAAGMSAALWCAELGLKTLLLESESHLGGQLLRVYNPIENHLGATAANGREMRDIFAAQLKKRKFFGEYDSEVKSVNFKTKTILLHNGRSFSARAIIIATGASRRKLGVEGEDKFTGKGILESGKRDAGKVKDKTVCIIGGGDAALENAEILSQTAAKIYLVHRRRNFRARPEFVEQAKKDKKVEILMETAVTQIIGNKQIEAVKLMNLKTKETFILSIDALVIRIGVAPNTKVFQGKIKLDDNGYIKINSDCETNVKNVFAIGDVASPHSPTISTAIGMGATAAKMLFDKMDNIQ